MSYADWEAQRGEVQIPKWMEKILRIPGGAFCLLLILLPFTLVRLLCFSHCQLLADQLRACCREPNSEPLKMHVMHKTCMPSQWWHLGQNICF